MDSVNAILRDRAIRHAMAFSRYNAGLAASMVKLLNTADAEIVARLASGLADIEDRGVGMSPSTWARLERVLADVRAINAAIYDKVGVALTEQLERLSASESEFQHASLTRAIPLDVTLSVPTAARLKSIVTSEPFKGRLLGEYLRDMEAGRISRISDAIRQGMIQGETTDQLVRRVRGTKAAQYTDGVLQISRRSATTIVRTAASHVSNVAAQETWRAAGSVVKGWQFLATLDSRTSLTCASMDGRVFPVGEGNIPPLHYRCRSISVAVTKSFAELGVAARENAPAKRASMDGQVAPGTRFDKWLTSKSTAVQDEVLGKTRADLFRSGKLRLSDMTKDDGTVLTLDQLKKAHSNILG